MQLLKDRYIFGILLAGLVVCAVGCGPSVYEPMSVGHYGYMDNAGNLPGSFEIHFNAAGRTWDFVKSAGFYRCAEVTYEKSFRYYRVLKMDDETQDIPSPGYGNTTVHTYIPGIKLKIQCYSQRPAEACYDAYDYLNKVPVPGTATVFTIEQRKAGGSRPTK